MPHVCLPACMLTEPSQQEGLEREWGLGVGEERWESRKEIVPAHMESTQVAR